MKLKTGTHPFLLFIMWNLNVNNLKRLPLLMNRGKRKRAFCQRFYLATYSLFMILMCKWKRIFIVSSESKHIGGSWPAQIDILSASKHVRCITFLDKLSKGLLIEMRSIFLMLRIKHNFIAYTTCGTNVL